jgi:hypothetical protein
MFALAQTDLFSEYRNYLTGVEYCISLLRSRRMRSPVRLQLSLPPAEVEDGMADRSAWRCAATATSASDTTNASGAQSA